VPQLLPQALADHFLRSFQQEAICADLQGIAGTFQLRTDVPNMRGTCYTFQEIASSAAHTVFLKTTK
jgi:hypothetical protein